MSHIFYFFTLVALTWEFMVINSPKKVTHKILLYKDKKFAEYDDTYKNFTVFMLLYFGWTLVGLMSSQWPMFLLIILISLIPGKLKTWPVRMIDSAITFAILLFLLLNKYHFHIDVSGYIYQWILNH